MTGFAIRRLEPADLPAIVTLADGLDWRNEERRFGLLFEFAEVYGLAQPDGELIGTVTLTRYGSGLAAVGMMLVAKEHGGRGHGRALMEHAMSAAGDTMVVLFATAAGRPLYEKLGFVTLGVSTAHVGAYRGAVATSTDRASTADLPEIIELDQAVTGSDRSRMLTAYLPFADEMRVVRDGGAITAFGGRWSKPGQTVIGPLIAPDDVTALALADDLAAPATGPIRIDHGEEHPALGSWALDHGLPVVSTTSLMTNGGRRLPGDRHRWYMPVTLALG